MVKAISTIIATVLMLLIVIALAGTAYLFISGTLTSKTATAFEIVDSYGDTVTIRNIGTEPITSFRSIKIDDNDAIYRVDKQDASLVGYWKFDELDRITATDSSGKGNTGTFTGETFNDGVINGATFTSGNYGNALSFDGSDDFVSIDDAVSLDFGLRDFTVTGWIKIRSSGLSTQNEYGVINKNAASINSAGWGIEISSWGFSPLFPSVNIKMFNTGQSNWCNTCADATISTDTWHHFTGVRSGTTFTFYLDGVPAGTRTHADVGLNVDNSQPIIIGDNPWGPTFPGIIDEVRIYNRTLSQAEVQSDMNSPHPVNRTVAWYSFENDAKDRHNIVKGKAGAALSFDGSNDYAQVPDSASLDITGTVSFEAWIYPRELNRGQEMVSKWNCVAPPEEKGYTLEFLNTNTISFAIGTGDTQQKAISTVKSSAFLNNWHHVTGTFDRQYIKIYIDDRLEGTYDFGTIKDALPHDKVLRIGSHSGCGVVYLFNGTIDEVKIYNRALSEQEVKANYNIGSQINAGETATIKIYNQLSKGTHTLRLCTSSMCNTAYLTIQ